MPARSLTPMGFEILRALNIYRFLSRAQMLELGLAKDPGHLGKVLGSMVSAKKGRDGLPLEKEIGMLEFGTIPGVGRLSRLHYLAEKGAEWLEEFDADGPPAKPVKHPPRFQNDYFHRVRTVDFYIMLTQFAAAQGHDITLVRQYFNRLPKQGNTPARPSTSIDLRPGYIDPDSIYMLRDPDGTERLLLVEIVNGHPVKRVAEKFPKYAQAIHAKHVNDAFNFGKRAPRVLWLFEHQRTMELVQQRLAEDRWVQATARVFFLRTLESCTAETMRDGWQRVQPSSGAVSLF